jgi:hypothetical protein
LVPMSIAAMVGMTIAITRVRTFTTSLIYARQPTS